jgi:hypothetical protein
MKRIAVIANVETMRAFHLGNAPADAIEIALPPDAATKRPWQDLYRRMEEIAESVNWLIKEEKVDSWVIAAPFGVIVNVLPSLDGDTKNLLAGAEIEDLTSLTSSQVVQVFASPKTQQAA